jgi:hypothetical protein
MSMAQPASDSAADESSESESLGGELYFLDVEASASAPSEEPAGASPEPVSESVGDSVAESAPPATPEPGVVEPRPFVTETMAELYLKQGFRREALAVYEQLSSAHPADERLSARVESLRAELAAPAKRSGPPVREFFARFASRRPGERSIASAPPAFDDFGPSDETTADTGESAIPSPPRGDAEGPATAASDRADATSDPPRVSGSIDALFGNQAVDAPEDSAAAALAQAFGQGSEATPITGNPTRPAAGELTLDSVFRDGGSRGPRTSQGFSFDQFFSQNVDGEQTSGGAHAPGEAPESGEPAERSEDDIEQFNSWLQGLKQR